MAYRLPNGKKLDEKGILVAITDDNVFNHHFLDIKTGKVKFVSEEFDEGPTTILKRTKAELNQRYFEIPKLPDKERHACMKEFVAQMIGDETLRNKLNFILDKSRNFQLFEKVLYADKSGWIWGWVQWKYDYLWEKIEDWFFEAKIEAENKWEYFDDCPVCQAMKFAEENGRYPTSSELREAFKKAKEKGAVVGGEWFKEPDTPKNGST